MAGFSFDAFTLILLVAAGLLFVLIAGILVQRQIWRLHFNSARREPNVVIGASLGKADRRQLQDQIMAAKRILTCMRPNFAASGADMMAGNAQHRMNATDAYSRFENDLIAINSAFLHRRPEEAVHSYLRRIREEAQLEEAWPQLAMDRISLLYTAARFQPESFDEPEFRQMTSAIETLSLGVEANRDRLKLLKFEKASKKPTSPASGNGPPRRRQKNSIAMTTRNGHPEAKEDESLISCV